MRDAEKQRVARGSGLGVGRRPQVSAAKVHSRLARAQMRERGLKRFNAAHIASHQRDNMLDLSLIHI